MTYDNYEERRKKFAPNDLPKSITREIYIHYRTAGSSAGEIDIFDCNLSGSERILLHKMLLTIKIPPQEDLKTKVVEALENEIQEIQANAHMEVEKLRERIENLLALEYKPQTVTIDETANDLPF